MTQISDTTNLTPLRVVEILDRSLWLVKSQLSSISLFCLLVGLSQVLTNGGLFPDSLALTAVSIVIGVCGAIYINISMLYFAQACWLELPVTIRGACGRFRFGIFLKGILCGIFIGIGTLFFALFLIIPGIVFFGNRVMAYYEILFYDRSIKESLKKSKWLMTQKSWYSPRSPMMRLSGLWLILMMITMVITIISGILIALIAGASFVSFGTQTNLARIATVFFSGLVSGLSTAFSTLAGIGFYYDLRVRYEGTDLLAKIGSLTHGS